ncbi:MAG: hypothetical protein IJT37_09675 [Lachnospiraceae bacterium]|nr:hypothetical protein [Lachnospiraceae bacterium]
MRRERLRIGAEGRRDMLKVRLMGTKRDMKWFQKVIERDRRIQILRISEPYAIKGSNRYYRMYVEVDRNDRKAA